MFRGLQEEKTSNLIQLELKFKKNYTKSRKFQKTQKIKISIKKGSIK